MRGLNRFGDFRQGTPIDTATHNFGNPITWKPDPAEFGNPMSQGDDPTQFGNPVILPHEFDNPVGGVPVVPTFDPPAGSYTLPQFVRLASEGADEIYYTTDGTSPDETSQPYRGSIFVALSQNIKAVAVTNGVASLIGSAAYVII